MPSNSEASNYLRSRSLLDALALRPRTLQRVRTELPLEKAAKDDEQALGAMLRSGVASASASSDWAPTVTPRLCSQRQTSRAPAATPRSPCSDQIACPP